MFTRGRLIENLPAGNASSEYYMVREMNIRDLVVRLQNLRSNYMYWSKSFFGPSLPSESFKKVPIYHVFKMKKLSKHTA